MNTGCTSNDLVRLSVAKQIVANVRRGLELLDKRGADTSVVDTTHLDIEDGEWCVLGQMFDGFDNGIEYLFGGSLANLIISDTDVYYGFAGPFDWTDGEMRMLVAYWKRRLDERFAAEVANIGGAAMTLERG